MEWLEGPLSCIGRFRGFAPSFVFCATGRGISHGMRETLGHYLRHPAASVARSLIQHRSSAVRGKVRERVDVSIAGHPRRRLTVLWSQTVLLLVSLRGVSLLSVEKKLVSVLSALSALGVRGESPGPNRIQNNQGVCSTIIQG